jgi:hypothetical protein
LYIHEGTIQSGVAEARRNLAPDVVDIDFTLGEDWSGDPAVFFRIVLSDDASRESRLREVVRRVPTEVDKDVKPLDLGLSSYFTYRSQSENEELNNKGW